MIQKVENIEDNYYGNDLRKLLLGLKAKYPDTIEINSFLNLCRGIISTNFIETIDDTFLNNFENIDYFRNKEIRARWREYLSIKFKNEKKEHLRKAVILYLEIYSFNNNYSYLIHALRLVKKAKGLFEKELERLYETGKDAVSKLDEPLLQREILVEIHSLFPDKTRIDFENFITSRIEFVINKNDYLGGRWLLEILKIIKSVSAVEYKVMVAENYEKEGDHLSLDKQFNTYYPQILPTYEKGLRELKSIKCDKTLRKRLEDKVLKEQKEQVRMHLAVSNEYIKLNEERASVISEFGNSCINQSEIFDFHSGYKSLISFPISLGKYLNNKAERNSSLSQFFKNYQKIDSDGKVVGKATIEEYNEIEDRKFWRECVIIFLKKAKWRMDEDMIIEKDSVYFYITKKCNSLFIPEDRKMLFARGIYAGFKNDFTTSAHILVPQLENSLKYVLKSQGILTAKIYDEIQHDNMFGGILDIYIKKNGNDIFSELKDFFLENSSVNFRNELCHGLLSPFVIEHYGIYVWWLTLKLIFDKEKIFINKVATS